MLDIDVKLLRSFVELARDRSFTRTAARLHMTQPTLSLQIQRLEGQVGLTLFHRSTRAVELTADGHELLGRAQRLVNEGLAFEIAIRDLVRGSDRKLHLGAALYTSDLALRNTIIDRFMSAFPDTTIVVHNAPQPELIAALDRHKLDVAFIMGIGVTREHYEMLSRGRRPGEGVYPTDLRTVVIAERQVELVVPQGSPLALLPAIPPEALTGKEVAMLSSEEGAPLLEPIVKLLCDAHVSLVYPPESHYAAAVERYGKSKGIPALSLGWFDDGDAKGEFVRRPIIGCNAKTELAVLAPASGIKPFAEEFLDLTSQVAAESLAPS